MSFPHFWTIWPVWLTNQRGSQFPLQWPYLLGWCPHRGTLPTKVLRSLKVCTIFRKPLHTVDGSEIRLHNQLRYGKVYPIICRGFIHPRWLFGISSINTMVWNHLILTQPWNGPWNENMKGVFFLTMYIIPQKSWKKVSLNGEKSGFKNFMPSSCGNFPNSCRIVPLTVDQKPSSK